jgi:predicted CXXCH cytochrome family protein
MSRGETGKQRQTRIELGYYKRPDGLARLRRRMVLLALALAGLWIGLAPLWDGARSGRFRFFEWNRLASPGPVARVHSAWESRCEACHVPFQPMNGSRWSPLPSVETRVSDRQCQACHAGPPHHASAIAERVAACAECHRDHRGVEASLVRIEDAACTRCHSNLEEHRSVTASALSPPVASAVTHFDANPAHHPEFRARSEKDPGQLRFNHALHMAKGFTLEKGGKAFTFAQIAEAERARYGWSRGLGLGAAVPPLECASCHQLDPDPGNTSVDRSVLLRSIIPPRNAGAYMLGVTYQSHCRACHPLEFDAKSPGRQVRHGLAPREILDELRQFYAAQAVEADPKLLDRFIPPRPKPGVAADLAVERAGRAVDEKLLTALRILLGSGANEDAMQRDESHSNRRGCVLCHHLSGATGPFVRSDAIKDVDIAPVKVPPVWFERAIFDHSAHRAVDCTACHSAAKSSVRSSDVLLPGIANCIRCHGPASGGDDEVHGGAGDSCTECHRYHNGDDPLQGKGATARGVDALRTIDQFLGGARKSTGP